jgi:hypothetical protein
MNEQMSEKLNSQYPSNTNVKVLQQRAGQSMHRLSVSKRTKFKTPVMMFQV